MSAPRPPAMCICGHSEMEHLTSGQCVNCMCYSFSQASPSVPRAGLTRYVVTNREGAIVLKPEDGTPVPIFPEPVCLARDVEAAMAELRAERDNWRSTYLLEARLRKEDGMAHINDKVALEALTQERNEARYHARVLASAWERDARPPADSVKAALGYAVDQRAGSRP